MPPSSMGVDFWIGCPARSATSWGLSSSRSIPEIPIACGSYTTPHSPNGAILPSDDRGRTFKWTDMPFKFGGGEDGRGNGERFAVDPGDGRTLYLGTRRDGLWRSQDRGATWKRVTSFPTSPRLFHPRRVRRQCGQISQITGDPRLYASLYRHFRPRGPVPRCYRALKRQVELIPGSTCHLMRPGCGSESPKQTGTDASIHLATLLGSRLPRRRPGGST
jgi:hypothetical protein